MDDFVYCKECKWQNTDMCPSWYEESGTYRDKWRLDKEDDFCSRGERKPKFNEQDISDAKAILRVFPWAEKIVRYANELQVRAAASDGRIVDISVSTFPSILYGEKVDLQDILKDGE